MGRKSVAIFTSACAVCLLLFGPGCEAATCKDWNGTCTEAKTKKRRDDDASECPSTNGISTCDKANCCSKNCQDFFTGKCTATQVVRNVEVSGGGFNWSSAGKDSCCETTCSTAKKTTCAAGKILKAKERCISYEGSLVNATNPDGKKDECAKADRCCETKTCMHTTCDMLGGKFDNVCKPHCKTECKDLNGTSTTEQLNTCGKCLAVKPPKAAQCFECLKCYDDLHIKTGSMTYTKPKVGTAGAPPRALACWWVMLVASALLVVAAP